MEKFKSVLQMIAAAVGVLTMAGAVLYKTGWVISRADAQVLIAAAGQEVAQAAAQAISDESKAREKADLTFQKEPLVEKIKGLMDIPNRTGAQQFELEQANKDLDRINARLDELSK